MTAFFDKKTLQNLFIICQQVQEFYFEYIQQSQFGDQFFVCHGKDFLDHHSILHKKKPRLGPQWSQIFNFCTQM